MRWLELEKDVGGSGGALNGSGGGCKSRWSYYQLCSIADGVGLRERLRELSYVFLVRMNYGIVLANFWLY